MKKKDENYSQLLIGGYWKKKDNNCCLDFS